MKRSLLYLVFAAIALVTAFGLSLIDFGSDADNNTSTTAAPYVIGQDGVIPPIGTQDPKPATNDYPFSRWITLPADTQQLSVYIPNSTTWIGTFKLPASSLAAIEALRREAESKGLTTISIGTAAGGFTLHGDIEGLLQVQSFDATSQTILIALTKLPR